jgi:hypothetical protein
MKLLKSIYFASVFFTSSAYSQGFDDIARYSQTGVGGSAFSSGMGGAVGALGADFTCSNINPAGIGLFRKSEFAGSAAIFNYSNNSKFYGVETRDRKFNFNIPNLNLVLHFPSVNRLKTTGWLSSTLAFGFNRSNSLHQQFTVRGINTDGSIVNAFANEAGNIEPSKLQNSFPYSADLAWNSYLIDTITNSNGNLGYTSFSGPVNGGVTQRDHIESTGKFSESSLAFAANHSNKLYIGASVGIRRIVYDEIRTYSETNLTDSIINFNNLEYTTNKKDKGTSFTFHLGAIYRVKDWLRLGAAATIPLDFSINRFYSSNINSSLSFGNYSFSSPEANYNYKLRQPARFTGSAAFIIKKNGTISIDYETVNNAKNLLVSNDATYDNINDLISKRFSSSNNIRIGAEIRINDSYLRGGFQMIGSALINKSAINQINNFSIGGGYRVENYFFDVAYVLGLQKIQYYPYSPNLAKVNAADMKIQRHSLIFTIGSRF